MAWNTGLAILLSVSACSDDSDTSGDATTTTTQVTAPSADPLAIVARSLGCDAAETMDPYNGPIRSGAATEWVRCTIGDAIVDVFGRGPLVPGDDRVGGSLHNIARIFSAGPESTPGCGYLVTEQWIIVSNERDVLDRAVEQFGGTVAPIQPVASPISYTIGGCI